MMRSGWLVVALSIGLGGCKEESKPAPPPSAGGVEIVMAPPGDLPALVKKEMARATTDGRELLLYVGAVWCEPCTRFHDAAERGELDASFPKLRLLELDRDRDEDRLRAADCISKMIPLFSRPTPEGHCDLDRSMMGSIKGPGAVANITPRLRTILNR